MIKKICFAASSGGHLEEISRLKEIEKEYSSFLLTEKGNFNELDFTEKVIYVSQINRREKLFVFKFIALFFKSFQILIKEKPDCIISLGALATYPICLLGKIMGKKIIYIESFSRVDAPSLSGKLMYRIADLFIVQWRELLEYFPKAVYGGGIF
ncbi:PssD/Cps14F family polysaccharide biosynthesis glycosyltransferase [Anaerosporobacter sp.]